MVVYCIDVWVKPGNEDEFIKATEMNHLSTRKEAGNIRFDLSKSEDTEGLFFLYEVYHDENAVAEHKKTAHYAKWSEKVEPWMAKPRAGRMFAPVFPADRENW